jgi:hypothetical protein
MMLIVNGRDYLYADSFIPVNLLLSFVSVLIIIHMNILVLLKILLSAGLKHCIDFTILCCAQNVLIYACAHICIDEAMDAAMRDLHRPDLKTA